MRSHLSLILEVVGAATMLIGFMLGVHYLRAELPMLIGAGLILVGHYLVK